MTRGASPPRRSATASIGVLAAAIVLALSASIAARASAQQSSGTDGWCIVCDAPAPAGALTTDYRGRRVTVCNETCKATFLGDPDEYFSRQAHRDARGALFDEHAPANQTPQDRSLVSGWMWFGLYVVAGLVCGAAAAYVAMSKGIAPLPWLFAGLALNVVGLALVVAKPRGDLSRLPQGVPAGMAKIATTYAPAKCPKCGAENHPSARSCIACGAVLTARVESEATRAGVKS
jgi:YHS domain-containing protein